MTMGSALIVLAALLATSLDAGAQQKLEPRFHMDAAGERVIGMSGLLSDADAEGCASGSGSGVVVERRMEKRQLVGFFYNDSKHGRSYLNLLHANEFANRATWNRVKATLEALVVRGTKINVEEAACGAAGRIVYLKSIMLADPPAKAAARSQAPDSTQPQFKLDASGRVIELSNLPATTGCLPAVSHGRVTGRHFEKGVVRGIAFIEPGFGEVQINLPEAYQFKDAATWARVADAMNSLLAEGIDLRIGTVACGAAGRIVKLTAVTLLSEAPNAAAPGKAQAGVASEPPTPVALTAPGWRIEQPAPAVILAGIASIDRAFNFTIRCSIDGPGLVSFTSFFQGPKNWRIANAAAVAIDGRPLTWEIDGADDGLAFSDSTSANATSLSAAARSALRDGRLFEVKGSTSSARILVASFDIAGGGPALAAFEERCAEAATARQPVAPATAAATPSPPVAAPEDDARWQGSRDGDVASLGIVYGNHFGTFWARCERRSAIRLIVDESKSRARVGARRKFSLSAGSEAISIEGRVEYSESDETKQILARVSLTALRPILVAMSQGSSLSIAMPSEVVRPEFKDAEKAAAAFLVGCGQLRQ